MSQNVLQVEEEESGNELVEIFSNEILHSRIQCRHLPSPPPDAIIVPDPIEHYYRSLEPGEEPDRRRLEVASSSHSVRSILAKVGATRNRLPYIIRKHAQRRAQ